MLPLIIYWGVYQKYESGIQPPKKYYELSQGSMVMFHNELCEGRMAVERLSAQYFVMHDKFVFGNK